MKNLTICSTLLVICLSIFSCRKDSTVKCEPDPRSPALGTYTMLDTVFFPGTAPDTITYDLIVRLDTLTGDTILLENMFDFSIDLKAVYNSTSGNFVIPPQIDDEALVSGTGNFTGNTITYNAAYDDGGYSFVGKGVK